MTGAIDAAFPVSSRDTVSPATRYVHLPDPAAAAEAWPAVLFHEKVAFNWLFLGADDLPAACGLLRHAQRIAPTLVYCRVPERGTHVAQITALLESESSNDGLGIILSCHTDSTFQAPQLMRAFSRVDAVAQPVPARSLREVRSQDLCYAPARELILSRGAVSLSLVQRTLRIGYTRASQLIDAMVGDILARDAITGALSLRQACARQAPLQRPVQERP